MGNVTQMIRNGCQLTGSWMMNWMWTNTDFQQKCEHEENLQRRWWELSV